MKKLLFVDQPIEKHLMQHATTLTRHNDEQA